MNLLRLIDSFLSGDLSALAFEIEYMDAWRSYRDSSDIIKVDEKTQFYIDRVFTALDTYCADPELRDDGDLDENELLSEVIRLNKQWRDVD